MIDDDVFPTNRFEARVRAGEAKEIPGFKLMAEYVRMNLRNPVVRWGTTKTLLLDRFGRWKTARCVSPGCAHEKG